MLTSVQVTQGFAMDQKTSGSTTSGTDMSGTTGQNHAPAATPDPAGGSAAAPALQVDGTVTYAQVLRQVEIDKETDAFFKALKISRIRENEKEQLPQLALQLITPEMDSDGICAVCQGLAQVRTDARAHVVGFAKPFIRDGMSGHEIRGVLEGLARVNAAEREDFVLSAEQLISGETNGGTIITILKMLREGVADNKYASKVARALLFMRAAAAGEHKPYILAECLKTPLEMPIKRLSFGGKAVTEGVGAEHAHPVALPQAAPMITNFDEIARCLLPFLDEIWEQSPEDRPKNGNEFFLRLFAYRNALADGNVQEFGRVNLDPASVVYFLRMIVYRVHHMEIIGYYIDPPASFFEQVGLGDFQVDDYMRQFGERDRALLNDRADEADPKIRADLIAEQKRQYAKGEGNKAAATKIQRAARASSAREQLKKAAAETKIQRAARGSLAREQLKKAAAATTIQRVARGSLARERVKKAAAATTIQRVARGSLARERVKKEQVRLGMEKDGYVYVSKDDWPNSP